MGSRKEDSFKHHSFRGESGFISLPITLKSQVIGENFAIQEKWFESGGLTLS